MADVILDPSGSGALPCAAVFENGVIVSVHNHAPSSRRAEGSPPAVRVPFTALAVDGAGSRALTCDAEGSLVLYDLLQQGYRRVVRMGAPAHLLLFDAGDPGRCFAALGDGTARVYDLDSGEALAILAGHRGAIFSLCQSADGGTVLTASADVALLWEVGGAWARRRALSYATGIAGAAMAAGAPLLALAFKNDSVIVWDLASYAVVAKLRLPEAEAGAGLRCVALGSDGALAAAGAGNGCAYVWDVPTGALVRIVDAPPPAGGVVAVGVVSAAVSAATAAALLAASAALGGAPAPSPAPAPPSLLLLDDAGRALQVELGAEACTGVLEVGGGGEGGALACFSLSQDARLLGAAADDGRWWAYDVPQARAFKMEQMLALAEEERAAGADADANGALPPPPAHAPAPPTAPPPPPPPAPAPPPPSLPPPAAHLAPPFSLPAPPAPPPSMPRSRVALSPSSATGGSVGGGGGASPALSPLRGGRLAASALASVPRTRPLARWPSAPPSPAQPLARGGGGGGGGARGGGMKSPGLALPHNVARRGAGVDEAVQAGGPRAPPPTAPPPPPPPPPPPREKGSGTEEGAATREKGSGTEEGSATPAGADDWGRGWGLREEAPAPRAPRPVGGRFGGLWEGVVVGVGARGGGGRGGGGRGASGAVVSLQAALLAAGASPGACTPEGAHARLRSLVASAGALPRRYRACAWAFLLRAPGNEGPAAILRARGPHPAWADLPARFPVRPRAALGRLSASLSAVAHWSPVLGALPVTPLFVFPFVKALWGNGGGCEVPTPLLEVLIALLLNYAAPWAQCLPAPPVALLAAGHAVLGAWDPQLAGALERVGADPTCTLWPLLRSAFSEVLPRGDWEALWDGLLVDCHEPALPLFAGVAFLRAHRAQLLTLCGGGGGAPVRVHPGARAGAGAGGAHGPFGGGPRGAAPPEAHHRAPTPAPPLPGFAPAPQNRERLAAIAAFLRSHAPTAVGDVLRMARAMAAECEPSLRRGAGPPAGAPCAGPPARLPRGFYPAFLEVPTYLVDAAAAERARIATAVAAEAEADAVAAARARRDLPPVNSAEAAQAAMHATVEEVSATAVAQRLGGGAAAARGLEADAEVVVGEEAGGGAEADGRAPGGVPAPATPPTAPRTPLQPPQQRHPPSAAAAPAAPEAAPPPPPPPATASPAAVARALDDAAAAGEAALRGELAAVAALRAELRSSAAAVRRAGEAPPAGGVSVRDRVRMFSGGGGK
jgi:hypothetical protein